MILESVHVKNLLSILDETLRLDDLTVLVGSNGSGKSAFLKALDTFFAGNPKLDAEDFHANAVESDVEITLTFRDLSEEARRDFGRYVESERFAVTRVFSQARPDISGKYFGSTLQHAAFSQIRDATSANEKKRLFKELGDQEDYAELPDITRQDEIEPALSEWEEAHPDRCERKRDSGQFLGYTGVGQGSLRRYLRFVLVPAVRDAAKELEEGKTSPISELLDLVVRSRMTVHAELEALKKDTQAKLKELVSPSGSADLDGLGSALSDTLNQYASDTAVLLRWQEPSELALPTPRALVKVKEHGFECTVDRSGHGLQRALIVTLLQHLEAERHKRVAASPNAPTADTGAAHPGQGESVPSLPMPDLVIAIEEPELYQHPNRQRHISTVLLLLAKGEIPGVAGRTQVIYSTHSPLLVSLDRMDKVRRATRAPGASGVKQTRLQSTELNAIAERLWHLSGSPGVQWSAETLRPRLEVILNPWMNEGFFSELVVLVEGESDRAAILAQAALATHDLEAMGISVIPCDGKSSMDRPTIVFESLGIPTYLVWDSDRDGEDPKPEGNRLLCRVVARTEEDYPSFVEPAGACIDGNLEKLLDKELHGQYGLSLAKLCAEQGLRSKEGRKKPGIVRAVLQDCDAQGHRSDTLGAIVDAIVARRTGAQL